MSKQLNLFDGSENARDAALSQVEESQEDWVVFFEACVTHVAESGLPFTTDDILRRYPSLESCPEKRCFGSVLMRMAKAGELRALGYVTSSRRASHARPKQRWIKE